ncbi:hypothetical protein Gotur_007706 [Gossypium turneri]
MDGILSHQILKNHSSIMKTYRFKLDQPRRNIKNSWLKFSTQWILVQKMRNSRLQLKQWILQTIPPQ